jgi:DegV family protein with EDD domain
MAILHFAASSGISAICSHAQQASERLPNAYVVDTRSLGNGVALLAKYAYKLMEEGETDPKAVYEKCLEKREKLQGSFLIETLECLYKGGRCSTLQYYGANLLKIKPVITLDKSNGKMIIREKCRGKHRNALEDYIKKTFERFPNPELKDLYIQHYCKDEELVKFFVDKVATHYQFENVHVGMPGCNCSIHCGPNTFGLFYFVK